MISAVDFGGNNPLITLFFIVFVVEAHCVTELIPQLVSRGAVRCNSSGNCPLGFVQVCCRSETS